jgi:phosphate transport system substrate-binding protein
MIAGTMADIINSVASYSNNPGAIGYSYYFYATTMYSDENAAMANNIKLLKIDGVAPNAESIKSGTYPFRTAYYIVINKASPADSSTRKLQEAMLSPRGQAVAAEAGYVPVK